MAKNLTTPAFLYVNQSEGIKLQKDAEKMNVQSQIMNTVRDRTHSIRKEFGIWSPGHEKMSVAQRKIEDADFLRYPRYHSSP